MFWLSWPVKPLGILLHLAFIPLLFIEQHLSQSQSAKKGLKFFGYCYLSFLVWNAGTTWWIYNATEWGGIFAIVANALLMCIPMLFFFYTKRTAGEWVGYFSFPIYWITFEYIHLNWDLTWPWLTLGNGFSSLHQIVQWYEYTGHLGGSLWVLIGNVLLFLAIRKSLKIKLLTVFSLWIVLPVAFSLYRYFSYQTNGILEEVVVVQPNIDSYEEKFPGGSRFIPYDEQLKRLMQLSEKKITPKTRFVLWPETALPWGYFEHELSEYEDIKTLVAFVRKHPQITLITGLDTYMIYEKNPSETARYSKEIGYYDAFNAALCVNNSGALHIYHKSKLVPGVEGIPPILNKLTIDLGGIAGGLGKQKERTVFFDKEKTGAAPVICYESVYGDFVSEYVRKGAEFIAIITNDGWWGNTPGHRQHLNLARLRCIETRKPIARSANTGISGFFNARGDITEQSLYGVQDVIRKKILANKKITFFVLYGDFIGKIAVSLTFLCLVIIIGSIFIKKSKRMY